MLCLSQVLSEGNLIDFDNLDSEYIPGPAMAASLSSVIFNFILYTSSSNASIFWPTPFALIFDIVPCGQPQPSTYLLRVISLVLIYFPTS